MDVILVAAMEINISDRNIYRETRVKEDIKNLSLNPMFSAYINRYRENLGIACLAAFLRENNYSVQIINSNIESRSNREIIDQIMLAQPLLVGFSIIYELQLFNTLSIIYELRNRGYEGHISIGGPCASCMYDYLLKTNLRIDSVIRGEGEYTILNLVKSIEEKKNWKSIEGLAYIDHNNIIYNRKKKCIEDLSSLPFAARDSLYFLKNKGFNTRTASIYSSRGCKGNCIYCTAPQSSCLENVKWRCRSGESLFYEVEYLVKEFGVEYLYFCDVNFIGYGDDAKVRLETFSKKIIENNIKISFHAEIRADSIEHDMLMLLKKAGLKDVLLGIESGSQRLLNLWKKGISVQKNKDAINEVKKMGFLLEPAMIMVSPKTNRKDLIETIDFIIETKIFEDNIPMNMFNKMVLFRGSKAEENLKLEGFIPEVNESIISQRIQNQCEIKALCKELISKEYSIEDKCVDAVWEGVILQINKLTWLIEDFFPEYVSERYLKYDKDDKNNKEEFFSLVHSIKGWRRNLDSLIYELLLCMKKNLLSNNSDMSNIKSQFENIVFLYEKKYFEQTPEVCDGINRLIDIG